MTTTNIPRTGRLAGLITSDELRAAGLLKHEVQGLVERGHLLVARRGVYADTRLLRELPGSGAFRDRAVQIAAAVAIAGPGAAASHADAALLGGLDLLEGPPADVISVTRPTGHDRLRTGRPSVRIRIAPLPESQIVLRAGVPVTSVARTVTDLARTAPFSSGVVVADSALHARKTTSAELREALAACAQWPGSARAREIVGFADGRAESPFESIARVAFRDGGLPPPDLQVWVGGESGPVGRVDFLWRQHRTIAEADGALKYADPDRARQQLRRDAELRDAGFEVVHFSWMELTRAPGRVIQAILAAFARAAALRAAG